MKLRTVIAAIAVTALSSPVEAGDKANGKELFDNCAGCHEVGPEAHHGIGPALNGVIAKRAASAVGFNYSPALRDAGASGLVWNEEALDHFLTDPHKVVPGTRMTFPGFEEAGERADVIAYLKTFADLDLAEAHREVDPTEIGASAMTIDGDTEFGEYLATECLTCHHASGDATGIPSIVGWDRRAFVRALFLYKTNVRSHDVMKLMTTNLGNEEIAALAAYFEKLGK